MEKFNLDRGVFPLLMEWKSSHNWRAWESHGVNYPILKMEVIPRDEFNGVWIWTNFGVFSTPKVIPFEEEFSQLLGYVFLQKLDDFYYFSMAIKDENSTQNWLLSTQFPHLSGWNTGWFSTSMGLTVPWAAMRLGHINQVLDFVLCAPCYLQPLMNATHLFTLKMLFISHHNMINPSLSRIPTSPMKTLVLESLEAGLGKWRKHGTKTSRLSPQTSRPLVLTPTWKARRQASLTVSWHRELPQVRLLLNKMQNQRQIGEMHVIYTVVMGLGTECSHQNCMSVSLDGPSS